MLDITKTIRKIKDRLDNSEDVFIQMRNLGKGKGYLVCPDPIDMNKEWLYDMVWYKEEKVDRRPMHLDIFLKEIVFIMEYEKSKDYFQIRYDFEKLLQSDARLKLMVCRYNKEEDFKNLNCYFEEAITRYVQQNRLCNYLIALYDENKKKYNYITY